MILEAIQKNELGKLMRERMTCILSMNAVHLNLCWTAEFPPEQIHTCCVRMVECLDCTVEFPKNVQRELLQNTRFAAWLARLISLTGETAADNEAEERPPDWKDVEYRLADLLETCWSNEKAITGYSEADVLFILKQLDLTAHTQLVYLENFAPMELDDGARAQIILNLSACVAAPIELDGSRRALLAEPFVATRYLFASADFEDIWALFQFCPALAGIARLLHQEGVTEDLTLTHYQYFAEDGKEYLRLLDVVLQRLSVHTASRFLRYWQQSNCALGELQRMERQTRTAAGNLDSDLAGYAGYVSLLYGCKFKTIPFENLAGYQEPVLTYAITHGKKHFIRLVDENGPKFLDLSSQSILFYEPLYRDHFNLNELTARDLEDCGWMVLSKHHKLPLAGGRQYTFPELKLLYDAPQAYATLYHKLHSPRLDDRIRILRQLRKRDVLRGITDEAELTALAGMLDQKPLSDWQREEFGHIRELRAEDAARLLVYWDKLCPLLPGIRCRTDVMLVLRSLEIIDRFDSVDALKANLLEVDQDWLALARAMELGPDFKNRYQEDIIRFLCRDGAGIARRYLDCLDPEQHPAFHRVVKAELMGQFNDLKYHTGDLEQELDYPLDTQAKVEWRENLALAQKGIDVRERDDFFSTMLLGTRPQRTCLSYDNGAYCGCLLACFDSNKKVLYAEKDGQIVARACIRLTKCWLGGEPKSRKGSAKKFSFVDLEDANGATAERHQDERLALFLEYPYSSGMNPEEQLQVEALFVELVRQKAEALGAMLVLSLAYREAAREGFAQTSLHLYISASKAGGQYLDSLGGKAEVSSEGSYKKNVFLVEQAKSQPGGIDGTMCA